MAVVWLILGVILFIGLIVVHEFGHFVVARRNGVEAEEFGIGFPPKAWSRTIHPRKTERRKHLPASARKSFEFSLNWLPLGGFVRLKGEHDSDTTPGSFGAASTWAKTKIMAAGIFMNLIAALVLFTIVALIGMPKLLDNQFTVASDTKVSHKIVNAGVVAIGGVVGGSPAAKAGLQKGDQVVSVAGAKITATDQVSAATKAHAGQNVEVVIKRDGHQKSQRITLNNKSPYLGIEFGSAQSSFEIRRSTWSAPIVAVGVTRDFTVATFKGLWAAIKGVGSIIAGVATSNKTARQSGQTAAGQLSGPVGIVAVLWAGAHLGFGFVLFVVGIISLSLAIMNVLPIPALDGGKLFITYVSRLIRKPVTANFEDNIYGVSFLVLIGLVLLISIVDVKRFF